MVHTHAGVCMGGLYPLERILPFSVLEHQKMLGEVLRKLDDRNENG
jgi:hypothetical protein